VREWRLDAPAPGVRVAQPVGGFKYTSDSFWLAGFALESGAPRTALDLGTGSGIVAFLLASAGLDVVGVDAAPEWAEGWRRAEGPAVRFVTASAADVALGPFDVVTCNPPYWPAGSGPAPRDPLVRAGRVEGALPLAGFVAAGLRHLGPGGQLVLVLPLGRRRELDGHGVIEECVVGDRVLVRVAMDGRPPLGVTDAPPERVRGWYERFGATPPRASGQRSAVSGQGGG
jgi:SAM-dependent methyltransferase